MLIIHGEDTRLSYAKLQNIIESRRLGGEEISQFDASELDPTGLRQLLGSSNLFGNTPTIVLTSIFTGTKTKQKEAIKKLLPAHIDSNLIIYEQKDISATSLKPLVGAQILHFKPNPIIFSFVESIEPGKSEFLVKQYHKLRDEGVEDGFLFAMLSRQIRLLIRIKSAPSSTKLPPFLKAKLQKQAQNFTLEQLLNIHTKLYQADKKIKLGITGTDFGHHILQILTCALDTS